MFGTMMKKELLQHLYSQKFMLMLLVTVSLMTLGTFVSFERYRQVQAEYDRGISKQRSVVEQYRSADEKSWNASFETSVFRKPTPLAVICHGMEYQLGGVANLDPLRIPFLAQSYGQMNELSDFDIDDSLDRILSHFDCIMVVRVLLSLMAVFMAFDLISGEREQETLKLIMANPVSRRTVLLAKISAGASLLAVVLLTGCIAALTIQTLAGGFIIEPAIVVRFGMIALTSLLYLLVFFLATACISSMIRSSHTTVVTMFTVWGILLFIIPTTAVMIGAYVSRIPPSDYLQRRENELNKEYYTRLREEQPAINSERGKQLRNDTNYAIWLMKTDYLNSLRTQQRFITRFSLVSPSVALDAAASYLAGTSAADYDIFMDRVRLVNTAYTRQVEKLSGKIPQGERISIIRETVETIFEASAHDNRLNILKSVERALPFIGWLLFINGFLLSVSLVFFTQKARVL